MLTAVILFFLGWLAKKTSDILVRRRRNAPYPPGPLPKPFIGNCFDVPQKNAHEGYMRWGEKYKSDILYANVLGNKVLVLNKCKDVDELLECRARIYSDRPVIPITRLMGWSFNTGLLPYGDEWRWHRKVYHQNFHLQNIQQYYPLQLRKVREMLKGLLQTPEDFEKHNKKLSIAIPMQIMYGYEIESIDDPCISAADNSAYIGNRLASPGANCIDIIPALAHIPAWFPGASSRKTAEMVRGFTEEMQRIPMEFVKKRVSEGTAAPSLVSTFLEKKNSFGASGQEEKVIKNVAYTVYGAASDTTNTATATFFFLMAVNPEIQTKAHQELDNVIGSDRLPDFADRGSLPYIEAIYREVMRWRPPLAFGVPHRSTEDDYYKGYFIPKGTTIFGNIWAMTHDPEVYEAPLEFKPDRFLDQNGKLNDDSRIAAFGFGRRVCPGRHLASSTVWLTIASILATFNIEKVKDQFGNDIEIDEGYEERGLVSHKTPFKCSIKPRSATAIELITEATSGEQDRFRSNA
ncbi:hypothetical protein GALMADRAFT_145141 [Galerina marginata CBS 339.88]|uniref:Cytochrome P450 n=1 Tax=Galerina marginata (strain CBS 339.88) TaxID=685588 RepID=A0A067SSH4_GALM3|nr:hypothetical protein GALMADRAFT_145141 [Galerina marginata CBS 339.88]